MNSLYPPEKKSLIEFFEKPCFDSGECPVCVGLFGVPEHLKVRAYTREEMDFYVQGIEFSDMKMLGQSEGLALGIMEPPKITTGEVQRWTGDYDDLERRINSDYRNQVSTLLVRKKKDVPRESIGLLMMLTSFYIPLHEHYLDFMRRLMEGGQNGQGGRPVVH